MRVFVCVCWFGVDLADAVGVVECCGGWWSGRVCRRVNVLPSVAVCDRGIIHHDLQSAVARFTAVPDICGL